MADKQISMTEAAYQVLQGKKRPIQFNVLWNEVRKLTKAPKENISNFYEDITLDPRFVCLKDNKWDLKERRSFADSHIDVKDISLDDDAQSNEEDNNSEDEDDKKAEDDYD